MKLSSQSGRPFMTFEIITKTVLSRLLSRSTPFPVLSYRPCPQLSWGARLLNLSLLSMRPDKIYSLFSSASRSPFSQGDLVMSSVQNVPVRLLGAEEHNSTLGDTSFSLTPFYSHLFTPTHSLPPSPSQFFSLSVCFLCLSPSLQHSNPLPSHPFSPTSHLPPPTFFTLRTRHLETPL